MYPSNIPGVEVKLVKMPFYEVGTRSDAVVGRLLLFDIISPPKTVCAK